MMQVSINGPAGRIEGVYVESKDKNAPLALVLPHPLNEGTMNNKVVLTMYNALIESGFSVLRINFRGVGRSQGQFDNGVGELTDAATSLDWLQNANPFNNVNLVAGFSFGAWIALQLIMRRPEIVGFIAASPPASDSKYDHSSLFPCLSPGLIIQGDQDSGTSEKSVLDLAHKLSKQNCKVQCKIIPGADHFFRGKTDQLSIAVKDYLQNDFNHHQFRKSNQDDVENTVKEKLAQKVFLY